jgi:hypothetical protein
MLRNGGYLATPSKQQHRNFPSFPESHRQQRHQNRRKAEVFDALCYLYILANEDAAALRHA